MNKEQKVLLGNSKFALFPFDFKESITNHLNYDYKTDGIDDVLSVPISKLGKFWKFVKGVKYLEINEKDAISFDQDKDQKSACLVTLLYGVSKISVETNNGASDFTVENSIFQDIGVAAIDIDFENPINKITLYFNFDLQDPLEIKVEINLYKEPEINYKELYTKNLNLNHSTGQDLVNIRFQKANSEVCKTKIDLYYKDNNELKLLASYNVSNNEYFKSITGLAYGEYSYKILQFDKDENLIVESDYNDFWIIRPNYGGKPIITNN